MAVSASRHRSQAADDQRGRRRTFAWWRRHLLLTPDARSKCNACSTSSTMAVRSSLHPSRPSARGRGRRWNCRCCAGQALAPRLCRRRRPRHPVRRRPGRRACRSTRALRDTARVILRRLCDRRVGGGRKPGDDLCDDRPCRFCRKMTALSDGVRQTGFDETVKRGIDMFDCVRANPFGYRPGVYPQRRPQSAQCPPCRRSRAAPTRNAAVQPAGLSAPICIIS